MTSMKQRTLSTLLFVATAMVPALAAAQEAVSVREPFAEQREKILEDLRGEKYREISPEKRSEVADALQRIQTHLERSNAPSIERMPQPIAVSIYNDQSLINTILTQAAEDSRLICKREKTIGSNFPQNNCLTVAERRRQKNDAQDDVVRMHRTLRSTN